MALARQLPPNWLWWECQGEAVAHILSSACSLGKLSSWLSGQTRSVTETLLALCAKISLASFLEMSSVQHLQQTEHQIRKPDSSCVTSKSVYSPQISRSQWLNGTCGLNLFGLALALSQFIWQFV